MKTIINFLLVSGIVAVFIVSCSKSNNSESNPYYNDRMEIHDTLIVYMDSFIYNPAIYYQESYKDTVFHVEGKWTNYPDITLFGNQKLILDTVNNISIKYKGGWVDRTDPASSQMLCDCFNDHEYISNYVPGQVIIYDDTIYVRRTVPVSYAIFEIARDSVTSLDTVYYDRCDEIKEIHNMLQTYDDRDTYFEKYQDYYYNYTYSNDYNILKFSEKRHQEFFSNFDKLKVKFKNSIGSYDIYLVDVFPYWDNIIKQNSIVLYVYIPNVFLGS